MAILIGLVCTHSAARPGHRRACRGAGAVPVPPAWLDARGRELDRNLGAICSILPKAASPGRGTIQGVQSLKGHGPIEVETAVHGAIDGGLRLDLKERTEALVSPWSNQGRSRSVTH